MRSHRLRFWAAVLCFVLLIAYFVIPVYRVDAASGTSSPLDAQTVLATVGQSLSGQYMTSNNPAGWSSTTWEYYGTYNFQSVINSNNISEYYSNLNCDIILYRADVSGLVSMQSGQRSNLVVTLDTSFENVSFCKLLCGISLGTNGYQYNANSVDNYLDYSLAGVPSRQDALSANGDFRSLQFLLDYNNSPVYLYLPMIEISYSSDPSSISLISLVGECTPYTLVNNQYAYFYIVCPVCNDDIVISGGGGSSGDTADIYDYLSNTLHDMMESNAGLLQSIYNFIVTIPDAILDGLHDLFIPSEQDLEDFKGDIDDLLHDTFGGLYDGFDLVHDNLDDLSATPQNTIRFPGISVAGFTLEAQDVPVKPAGFDTLFDALALVVDIVVTFAFLNMCKRKLFKFLSPEGGGSE